MSVRIIDVREVTKPIASPIRNAYIDFSKMTTSLVALVTDVVRDGHRVVGYGFNSNGRYGQGGLIRERFAPRLREADPQSLQDDAGNNLDPDRVWATMMANEKPGGHGERSVAVGTLDMAVWDAVAKIAGKPLFRMLAERHGVAQRGLPRVRDTQHGARFLTIQDQVRLLEQPAHIRTRVVAGHRMIGVTEQGLPIFG